MSSGVSLLHQTGALLILALGSLAIAFLPLSLLHVVFRKKRRRLREEELMQRSKQKLSPQGSVNPELGVTSSEASEEQQRKTQSQRSFIAGWFGLEGHWDHRSNEHTARTLSSRSNSASSLYQHFSEVALASTLAIPSIVLELIRSLDGGLLLATLFLILIPQLRTTFETFMRVHVHTAKMASTSNFQTLPLTSNLTSSNLTTVLNAHHAAARHAEAEAAQSVHLIAKSAISPVPLVELILCLAFFALHFTEEFAQLCLRYRKYFWACNASVVFSSSNGTCEFSSLDYRISRTKRFLIDCSRKTSSTLGSTTASRTSANVSPMNVNRGSRSQILTLKNQFVVTEDGGKDNSKKDEQTEPKQIGDPDLNAAENTDDMDQVCENHNLQDSLQLYNQIEHQQQDFEPNSLLTSESSSYLPSYYWPPVQPEKSAQSAHPNREFYQESGHDSMPYRPHGHPGSEDTSAQPHAAHYCCPCHHQHSPSHPFAYQPTPSENGSACTSSTSTSPGVFTKIFLPYTTLATSTPALYFCEGILIAIQPTAAMLWLMLAVILVHKLVTGLLVSFELHEKTTGRQRQLPPPTTILFIVLPLVGYLTVLLINGFFVLKQKDRQALAVASGSGGESGITRSLTDHSPIELAAVKVVLFAVASATLLHLVLLIIQRNLAQFQPQLQFRKPKAHLAPQHNASPVSQNTISPSGPTLAKSHTSNSISSKVTNSIRATTLAQVPMCAMASHNHSQPGLTGLQQPVSLDPEIVTNPPRFGVLHQFTMYTGFIIILMAIAFLNMKSVKV